MQFLNLAKLPAMLPDDVMALLCLCIHYMWTSLQLAATPYTGSKLSDIGNALLSLLTDRREQGHRSFDALRGAEKSAACLIYRYIQSGSLQLIISVLFIPYAPQRLGSPLRRTAKSRCAGTRLLIPAITKFPYRISALPCILLAQNESNSPLIAIYAVFL